MGIWFKKNSYAATSASRTRSWSFTRSGAPRLFVLPLVVFVLIALGVGVMTVLWQTSQNETGPCLVEDKDRTTTSDGGSDMRIYTDCGIFQVGDNFLTGHFSSADVYSSIKVGSEYTFDTIGWRFPLFSTFPTILQVTDG